MRKLVAAAVVAAAAALGLSISNAVTAPSTPRAGLSSGFFGDLHVSGTFYYHAHATVPGGATGPQGAAGVTGQIGPTGPQGAPGPVGPTGPAGSTSPTGVTPNAPVTVGALTLDDEFTAPQWGTVWSQMRATNWMMNNVTTEAYDANVGGGVLGLTLSDATHGGYVATCSNDGGGGFEMGYGYAEARIKLPVSGGKLVGWPAWWIVGSNWPANGETDILEGLGGSASTNYHGTTDSRNSGAISGNWYDGGWHTYGVDRLPGTNRIYWDGVQVASYPTSDNGAPNCLILNIGSNSGPNVNGAVMQADYVRVWAPPSAALRAASGLPRAHDRS